MMKSKFFLKRLVLGGNNKKNAILNFEEGLNVIAGASDTGKSLRLIVLTMDLGQVMCLHYHQKQKGTIVCILK